MMKVTQICLSAGLCLLLSLSVQAAPINQVNYFSLTGNVLIDFESLAGDTNYDGVIDLIGASFAERFAGQTLSYSGNSDILGGAPTGPLSLAVGAPGQNLSCLYYGVPNDNVLAGLGQIGFPDFDAIGEGAVTILFDKDQSEFGFESIGGNSGSAVFDFFARDGSLLGTLTPTNLGTDYFGFSRDGGVKDIAGISIYNTDPAGIGFDNIVFDVPGPDDPNVVPVPGSMLLVSLGLGGLRLIRKRKLMA